MSNVSYSASVFALDQRQINDAKKSQWIRITMDASIEREKLQKAVDRACEVCPYVMYSLEKKEGRLYGHVKHPGTLRVLDHVPELLDAEENQGLLTAVCVEGNRVTFLQSHCLTDGNGIFWFVRAVLDFYAGNEATLYQGATAPDFDRDPLAERLPEEEAGAEVAAPAQVFARPEAEMPFEDENLQYHASAEAFQKLYKSLHCSPQVLLTAIAARAVQEAYPENTDTVSVRIPVNARAVLETPNTFQNSSLVNLRAELPTALLQGEKTEELLTAIAEQMAGQNTKEDTIHQLNLWRDLLLESDQTKFYQMIQKMAGSDSMVVSYLGKALVPDAIAPQVQEIKEGIRMFPLMLYAVICGDKLEVTVRDATGDGKMQQAMENVLKEFGLI
ncbi:MAG: hypothetical protein IJJ13_04095 [Lachnospiraceae bacterium]|nr:hypothetical protein [Lachnospiraceae bacterium]